jgi:hypothetical protein
VLGACIVDGKIKVNQLESKQRELIGANSQAKILQRRYERAEVAWKNLSLNFELIDAVHRRQESWLHLFSSMQCVMEDVGRCWLDSMKTDAGKDTAERHHPLRIAIGGHLLVDPSAKDMVRRRVNGLIEGLRSMAMVDAVEDVTLLPEENHLQGFQCTLVIGKGQY